MRTTRGHRYLLVITDRFTKLILTVPLRNKTTAQVAKQFMKHWVFYYSPSIVLIADNVGQFKSELFQDVCEILNVHNSITTTYRSQTNGQAKRFNWTTLSALLAYILDNPRD